MAQEAAPKQITPESIFAIFSKVKQIMRTCNWCGKKNAREYCSGCKLARYCDRKTCGQSLWDNGHKDDCAELAKEAEKCDPKIRRRSVEYACQFSSSEIKSEKAQTEITAVHGFVDILQCYITNFTLWFRTTDGKLSLHVEISKRPQSNPLELLAMILSQRQLKDMGVQWLRCVTRMSKPSIGHITTQNALSPELARCFHRHRLPNGTTLINIDRFEPPTPPPVAATASASTNASSNDQKQKRLKLIKQAGHDKHHCRFHGCKTHH